MQTQSPEAQSVMPQKRKPFPWMLGVIVSSVFIFIFAFVVIALLILRSQGVAQGINTLTVLSIVVGFVVSVLSLLVSFLQWHHPKDTSASDMSEHPQSPVFLNDPLREHIEKNKIALTL